MAENKRKKLTVLVAEVMAGLCWLVVMRRSVAPFYNPLAPAERHGHVFGTEIDTFLKHPSLSHTFHFGKDGSPDSHVENFALGSLKYTPRVHTLCACLRQRPPSHM